MPLTLAQALGVSPDARCITTATAPFTIVHTNKAWSDQTGYKFTEIVGRECPFLKDSAAKALKQLTTAIETSTQVSVTIVDSTKGGHPCTIECEPIIGGTHFCATIKGMPPADSASPLRESRTAEQMEGADAAVSAPVSFVEQHRAKRPKRALQRTHLLDVLANTQDPLVLCSPEYPHVITHPNQAWLEMCGYDLEEVEGFTNSILAGPETDEAATARIVANAKALKPSCETVVNYKKGGVRFINQVHIQPVYDENDELAAFMSMLTEVDTR